MKRHLLGLAIAILTFVSGWSLPPIISKPTGEQVLLLRLTTPLPRVYAWRMLLLLQNSDLRELDPPQKAQLQLAIDSLRGTTENKFLFARLFTHLSTNHGEDRYLLVEESPLVTFPGDSRLRTSLFTANGDLVSSSEFGAGWRIALSRIRLAPLNGIGSEMLEVESRQMPNGADVAKQYYALVGDEMRLIRLEDSSGVLVQNIYSSPNHTIGFTPIGRSAADWQDDLKSTDVAKVLAALTWLGGQHLNVNEAEPNYLHEYLSEAQIVEGLRERSSVKQSVNSLQLSDNPWVRDAATAAAETIH
jgi:hypothetical protein